MASGRFLSTSIAEDERLSRLSLTAELLYLKTIPHLDRDGMIAGKPGYLWGKVCPLREELMGEMSEAINEWVALGLVVRTVTEAGPVLFFPGFLKNNNLPHYKRERPSRFSCPSGYIRTDKGLVIQDEVQESIQDEVMDFALQEQEEDQDQVDDDDARVRDPFQKAWLETYRSEMPASIAHAIERELAGCPQEAILHAIRVSVNSDSRSFKYLKNCALNYVPPPPATHGHSKSYQVDLPGVYQMPPAPQPPPAPTLPPPMTHDDPWAIALGELQRSLTGVAVGYLAGSRLEAAGVVDGVPLYRVVCDGRTAVGLTWLTAQAGPAIRRTLGSILGKPVLVEIVAAEVEMEPAS